MDSLITAAARALASGDPLGALKRVALREDAGALALRGIAMAQLGDFPKARALLKRARRAFGAGERLARARCVVAEAEIALVSRDLSWPVSALAAAQALLARHGDAVNAGLAGLLAARRLLLIGQLDAASAALDAISIDGLPAALQARQHLVRGGIALRRLDTAAAQRAFAAAATAARLSGIHGLAAEVGAAAEALTAVAARVVRGGTMRPVTLRDVEILFASGALIVDATRQAVRCNGSVVPLGSRPVLFALARTLGAAWPGDVSRAELVENAFGGREADESHRARLRVEIGRLRSVLRGQARIVATRSGFALRVPDGVDVTVLLPPRDDDRGVILALLADGEAWASSALAIATGSSVRTVQRALEGLAAEGRVQSFGQGRARRWIATGLSGFPTVLLLPGPMPGD